MLKFHRIFEEGYRISAGKTPVAFICNFVEEKEIVKTMMEKIDNQRIC